MTIKREKNKKCHFFTVPSFSQKPLIFSSISNSLIFPSFLRFSNSAGHSVTAFQQHERNFFED